MKVRDPLKKRSDGAGKGLSIKVLLIIYFAAFAAVCVLISWGSQILMIGTIYRRTNEHHLIDLSKDITNDLEKEQLSETICDELADSLMTAVVYRKVGDGFVLTSLAHDPAGVSVFFLSDKLEGYYRNAADAENGVAVFDDLIPDPSGASENSRMICARVVTVEGETYLIVLDAPEQPVDSMTDVSTVQFLWDVFTIPIFAIILVFLVYWRISKPLMQMNDSAKQLAQGEYDVEFPDAGFRETRELSGTLNYAANELSRLDRLQKELIANISHDLRTPLTMIKGYAEVMRDIPDEITPENMQVIIDETERLSDLVNHLMDLSKIQSGTRKAEIQKIHLTRLLRDVLYRYERFTKHLSYQIRLVADREVWVEADRNMMLQVLYNLINNAVNHTGEDLSVTVTQTVKDGRVRIGVTDTGAGIAPERLPQIWDRYYKADPTHRHAMIGTGLGLSIVKEILEQHGAAYGIESTVGQGATFWFELPVTESEALEKDDGTEELL